MASLADVHGALAGRLTQAGGLRVAANPSQGQTPPLAYPQLDNWSVQGFSLHGAVEMAVEVFVFTAQGVRPQDGYGLLMEYADRTGPRSIAKAIWDGNSANTFSGTFQDVTYTCDRTQVYVSGFRVLGAPEVDAFQMYGGVFTATVTTIN
jgi:hypothetical protein